VEFAESAGSGNVHCLVCILAGFKKLLDSILFSIKIENRWNGNNTPLESSFFSVKDFLWLNIISDSVRLGSEYQNCSSTEGWVCTLATLVVGAKILSVTTECGWDQGCY
jgi:hypothetical protein